MITKPSKIYYFASTHWDREWFKTFQSFRFRLVGTMNEIIEVLEDMADFSVFTLDGQTVMLEDYCEIEPGNKERLVKLLKDKRLLAGPWYTMPDEFLVSGESLISNLFLGHKTARLYGSEAMKYGYVCDIFGHIAQLPQILNGFNIKGALLGRGTNSATCPAHFIWESPDGSRSTTFKVPEEVGYGTFWYNVLYDYISGKDNNRENLVARACKYIDSEMSRSEIPYVVLMDAMDHERIHSIAVWLAKRLEEIYDCPVIFGNLACMAEQLEQYTSLMPVKQGELNETGKATVIHNMLITNTLSSRYDLKLENDMCQVRLEKWALPLSALAKLKGRCIQPSYLELAYKYLLKNHPHDSICGCSIDEVHRDMLYRFRQCAAISNEVTEASLVTCMDIKNHNADSYVKRIIIFNPLPFYRKETVSVDINFEKDYKYRFHEQMGYESKNAFNLINCNMEEVEYNLTDIKRSSYIKEFEGYYPVETDFHKITFTAVLPPMGYAEYLAVPSTKPVRYLKTLSSNAFSAENEYICLEINHDGTINIRDKETGKEYKNLLSFLDDGEIGDGWFHVNPVNDRLVTSRGSRCTIEKTDDGPAACTFRITVHMEIPESMDYHKNGINRSQSTTDLKIISTIKLTKSDRWIDVTTAVENTARDHRLKVCLPTGIGSSKYYADQAFAFVGRKTGFDRDTGDWKEHACVEKSFESIVLKRDADNSGIAFISGGGIHECAALDDRDGSIEITLFRSFGRTFMTDGQPDGQLIIPLTFRYRLLPFGPGTTFADITRIKDSLQTGIRTATAKVPSDYRTVCSRGSFMLDDGDIIMSVLKNPEDAQHNTVIVRLYNLSDHSASSKLECPGKIAQAFETSLLEENTGSAGFNGSTLNIILQPWKIQTYRITFEQE